MMRPLTRDVPLLPVRAMKTYTVARPLSTHWRQAACYEVDCAAHLNGWKTTVDEATELGQRQAGYIRTSAGRSYTECRDGGLTAFTFHAGQTCFAAHRIPADRPPLFVVRGGDWRKHIGTPHVHTSADAWLNDFAGHQERLARQVGGN